MPRIPMSDRPGFRHQEDTVPMRGAPGMDFGMDSARDMFRASAMIGEGGQKIAGALLDFANQEKDTENKLAATEARNLFHLMQRQLNERMAANPADYQKFGEWAKETDSKYTEDVRAYTDRMSSGFRKQFEAEMAGLQDKAHQDRRLIGVQANVTALKNHANALRLNAAKTGNMTEYKRILDDFRGVLWSDEEYQTLLLDYGRLADFYEAKRLVDAGQVGVVDMLKARDKDGNYLHFEHLEEHQRDRFIEAAKHQDAQRERETDDAVLAGYFSGNPVYRDQAQLDAARENHEISDGQYNRYTQWNREFESRRGAAESRSEKARNAALAAQIEKFKVEKFYDTSGKPETITPERADALYAEARKLCGANYKEYNELAQWIKGRIDSVQSGKDFLTEARTQVVKDQLEKWHKDKAFYWDPWGWGKEKTPEFNDEQYSLMYAFAMRLLEEPDENGKKRDAKTVITMCQERIDQLQSGKIRTILEGDSAFRSRLENNERKPRTVERTTSNGKIAIFDATTKKFLRWKEQK